MIDWLKTEVPVARWLLLAVVGIAVLNLTAEALNGHWVSVATGMAVALGVYVATRWRVRRA